MKQIIVWGLCLLCLVTSGCRGNEENTSAHISNSGIRFLRLRDPADQYDIEQGSGLHYSNLSQQRGLWLVCDRNGGKSAGKLFFVSEATLDAATHGSTIKADASCSIVLPDLDSAAFKSMMEALPPAVAADITSRINARLRGETGPFLDLEAVTMAPSVADEKSASSSMHIFAVTEEPYSVVLELKIASLQPAGTAELVGAYVYREAAAEQGTDRNDGLEGLAWAGEPGEFYWQEEGTRFHGGPPGERLFFVDPRIGLARLGDGQVEIDRQRSNDYTTAIRALRDGSMQTLNGLAVLQDQTLVSVDRNGGWLLHLDPHSLHADRWANLYDLDGINLRQALATFPDKRRMPYISIEGVAVDPEGSLWLVDDPAMPEGFRASTLVHIPRSILPERPKPQQSQPSGRK